MKRIAFIMVGLFSLLAILFFISNIADSELPKLKGKIAFYTWWLGGRVNIYVINADGTALRLLVKNASSPSWSPDGRRLVYFEQIKSQLRIINANGAGDVHLSGGFDERRWAYWPAWSPNGKWIACWETEPALPHDISSVVRIRPDSSQKEKLFVADKEEISAQGPPAWSPDSRRIVIAMGPKDKFPLSALYILDSEDKTLVQLTDLNQRDAFPVWAPDGKYIAFLRGWQLHLLEVQTSKITLLTDKMVSSPVWSPDGSLIAYSLKEKFFGIRLQDKKEEPLLSLALKDLKDMSLLGFSWIDSELFPVDRQEKLITSWGRIKVKN